MTDAHDIDPAAASSVTIRLSAGQVSQIVSEVLGDRGLREAVGDQMGDLRPAAPRRPGLDLLTPREAEVLEHLRRGQSNPQIALALSISVETVRTHVAHIRTKLGVRSRGELVEP